MRDAHREALEKAGQFLGNDLFLEITYKVPFGFQELYGRTNLSVDEFLAPSYNIKQPACLLHILLGCGVGLEKFIQVIYKAIKLYDRVIILEHNKNSKDWDWENKALIEDHSLHNCLSYGEFLTLCDIYGWEISRQSLIPGINADDRNFIVSLRGKIPSYDYSDKYNIFARLGIPVFRHKDSNFSEIYDVYLGTADSQSQFVANSLEKIPNKDYTLYASCGGFLSLNYIHMLRNTDIKQIVVFDINPYSVKFAETVFKLITKYDSIDEFLTNYLLCDVQDHKIIKHTWEFRIRRYLANYKLYNSISKYIFMMILNCMPFDEGLITYGFRNCADNRTDTPGRLYISLEADKFVNENSLNVGIEGWIKSDKEYLETQEVLKKTPIRYIATDIQNLMPADDDILIASNIFSYLEPESKSEFGCKIIEN